MKRKKKNLPLLIAHYTERQAGVRGCCVFRFLSRFSTSLPDSATRSPAQQQWRHSTHLHPAATAHSRLITKKEKRKSLLAYITKFLCVDTARGRPHSPSVQMMSRLSSWRDRQSEVRWNLCQLKVCFPLKRSKLSTPHPFKQLMCLYTLLSNSAYIHHTEERAFRLNFCFFSRSVLQAARRTLR